MDNSRLPALIEVVVLVVVVLKRNRGDHALRERRKRDMVKHNHRLSLKACCNSVIDHCLHEYISVSRARCNYVAFVCV